MEIILVKNSLESSLWKYPCEYTCLWKPCGKKSSVTCINVLNYILWYPPWPVSSWPVSANFGFAEFLLVTSQYMQLQEYVRLTRDWCDWNEASRRFMLAFAYLNTGWVFTRSSLCIPSQLTPVRCELFVHSFEAPSSWCSGLDVEVKSSTTPLYLNIYSVKKCLNDKDITNTVSWSSPSLILAVFQSCGIIL